MAAPSWRMVTSPAAATRVGPRRSGVSAPRLKSERSLARLAATWRRSATATQPTAVSSRKAAPVARAAPSPTMTPLTDAGSVAGRAASSHVRPHRARNDLIGAAGRAKAPVPDSTGTPARRSGLYGSRRSTRRPGPGGTRTRSTPQRRPTTGRCRAQSSAAMGQPPGSWPAAAMCRAGRLRREHSRGAVPDHDPVRAMDARLCRAGAPAPRTAHPGPRTRS